MPGEFSTSYIFDRVEGSLTLIRSRHRPYRELNYTCNLVDKTFTVTSYDACFPSPYCVSAVERVFPFESIHLNVSRWPEAISCFQGTPCLLDGSMSDDPLGVPVSDDPFDLESVARIAAMVATRALRLYDANNMAVGGGPSRSLQDNSGPKPSL